MQNSKVRLKVQEIIGVFTGLIFFVIWIFILIQIEFIFFSETSFIAGNEITTVKNLGQIDEWLTAGILPFLIISGHYLLYSNRAEGVEKIRDITAMKSTLIGFFIWLAVAVVTFLFDIVISYSINMIGGFTIMFVIHLFMDRDI